MESVIKIHQLIYPVRIDILIQRDISQKRFYAVLIHHLIYSKTLVNQQHTCYILKIDGGKRWKFASNMKDLKDKG